MESKLEQFKKFVKDKPYLAKEVKDGKISWQTLYETYDIFGEEHEFFKQPEEEKEEEKEIEETILLWQRDNLARNLSLDSMETYASSARTKKDEKGNEDHVSRIVKSLQKIDTKKISEGLDNVKKIVGMIDELRPSVGSGRLPSMRIKPFRRYND